jgi:hypothetical protein
MNLDQILAQLTGQRRESPLETQLRELRREIQRVSHSVSRQAGHAAHDWGQKAGHTAHDWSDELAGFSREAARRGAEFAEVAAYQAGRGAKALRNDPLPAIAILGTAFLVARLFSRR